MVVFESIWAGLGNVGRVCRYWLNHKAAGGSAGGP